MILAGGETPPRLDLPLRVPTLLAVRILLASVLLVLPAAAQIDFATDARPVLAKYCFSCHGADKQEAGLALHELLTTEDAFRNHRLLRQVIVQVEGDDMPPFEAKKHPSDAERAKLLRTLNHLVGRVDRGEVPRNPGRVTIRRLNRNEYNYTVRDLFGIKFQPGRNFPADGAGGEGFDNTADALFLPPVLMENYLHAANRVIDTLYQDDALRQQFLFAQPEGKVTVEDAARKILTYHGSLAYRRPLTEEDLAPLLAAVTEATSKGKKFEQAMRMLDRIAVQDSEAAPVDFRRAQIHMDGSNLDQALVYFRKAAEGMPGMAPPLFGAGVVLRLQNKLEQAKQEILRAVELEPSNVEFLWQLAQVYLGLNQPLQAIDYLERIENSDNLFLEVYRLLGDAYRRLGDPVRAEESLEKFQAMSTSQQQAAALNEETQSVIARAEEKLQEGQVDEALELFQQSLEKSPDTWLAHNYLAKIYLSSGYPRLAYQHLSEMARLAPESVEGNYLLGQYWYQQSDFRQARLYAEKAKAKYPGSGVLRNLLGNIYLELGQREDAIQEYAAAVRLDPERSDFQRNYQVLLRNSR